MSNKNAYLRFLKLRLLNNSSYFGNVNLVVFGDFFIEYFRQSTERFKIVNILLFLNSLFKA